MKKVGTTIKNFFSKPIVKTYNPNDLCGLGPPKQMSGYSQSQTVRDLIPKIEQKQSYQNVNRIDPILKK